MELRRSGRGDDRRCAARSCRCQRRDRSARSSRTTPRRWWWWRSSTPRRRAASRAPRRGRSHPVMERFTWESDGSWHGRLLRTRSSRARRCRTRWEFELDADRSLRPVGSGARATRFSISVVASAATPSNGAPRGRRHRSGRRSRRGRGREEHVSPRWVAAGELDAETVHSAAVQGDGALHLPFPDADVRSGVTRSRGPRRHIPDDLGAMGGVGARAQAGGTNGHHGAADLGRS